MYSKLVDKMGLENIMFVIKLNTIEINCLYHLNKIKNVSIQMHEIMKINMPQSFLSRLNL